MSDSIPMKILLVDDEKNIRQTLAVTLHSWGHEVVSLGSAEDAIQALKKEHFDFMLTDFKLGTQTGIDLVRLAQERNPDLVSVVMTAFASFDNAVNAIKEGAYDYLPKPFSNSQLAHVLNKVSSLVQLRRENRSLREASYRQDYFSGLTSPAMLRLEEFVRKIGPTEANLLLMGESGTGKTELAKLIHSRSPRAHRPFVVVNCTTLTESLIESELFGHVKGAFTGAIQSHVGKLEVANEGTVLIDEVGDLSLNGQAKLLRFLQEKVIERVGSNQPVSLDVRVIAATNRNLEEAVREGKFREDLYFRLNIFECSLVPLRYRKEDLPVLIERFLADKKPIPEAVMSHLLNYSWPGNVRELKNVMERLNLLSKGREMEVGDLPEAVQRMDRKSDSGDSVEFRTLQELEREQIVRVLAIENNQERAAKILGITTVTLWRKRKEYGLP